MAFVAMASVPLSALCSICHLKPPKYTCPGCTAHTCSLKCVTTHKKRTSCTGQRVPPKYVSRKDLNHPSVLDQDFNFISKVERGIESANRGAERMGIVREDDGNASGPTKGQLPLRKTLEADGITILKAPAGMTRSTSNKTQCRKGQVKWTVEWIWKFHATTGSGEQKLLTKKVTSLCDESSTIKAAWAEARRIRSPLATDNEDQKLSERIREEEAEDHRKDVRDPGWRERDGNPGTMEQLSWWRQTPEREKYSFYLDAPDLQQPGKEAALIPIDVWDGNTTLKDMLKGRTVREYPTIAIWSGCAPPLERYLVLEPYQVKNKQELQQVIEPKGSSQKRSAAEALMPQAKVAKIQPGRGSEGKVNKGLTWDPESTHPDEAEIEMKGSGQGEQQRASTSTEGHDEPELPVQPEVSGGSTLPEPPDGLKGLIGLDYSSD